MLPIRCASAASPLAPAGNSRKTSNSVPGCACAVSRRITRKSLRLAPRFLTRATRSSKPAAALGAAVKRAFTGLLPNSTAAPTCARVRGGPAAAEPGGHEGTGSNASYRYRSGMMLRKSFTFPTTRTPFSSANTNVLLSQVAVLGLFRPGAAFQLAQKRSMLQWCNQKIGSFAAQGMAPIPWLFPTRTWTVPCRLASRFKLNPCTAPTLEYEHCASESRFSNAGVAIGSPALTTVLRLGRNKGFDAFAGLMNLFGKRGPDGDDVSVGSQYGRAKLGLLLTF